MSNHQHNTTISVTKLIAAIKNRELNPKYVSTHETLRETCHTYAIDFVNSVIRIHVTNDWGNVIKVEIAAVGVYLQYGELTQMNSMNLIEDMKDELLTELYAGIKEKENKERLNNTVWLTSNCF